MAGDETKRFEAGTGPEAGSGASESSVPQVEPGAQAPSSAEPGALAPGADDGTPEIERQETAAPSLGGSEEPTSPAAELTANELSMSSPPPPPPHEPAARKPLLTRLVPYLIVFALGALISIGGAFLMYLLGGSAPDESGGIERRLAALDDRATALERKQEQAGTTLAMLAERSGAAEADARRAAAAVRELEKALAARPGPEDRTAGDAAGAAVDLGTLGARLTAMEQKLEHDKSVLDTAKAGAAASTASGGIAHATAIVAGRLVQEVARGEPYLHEIEALRAIGIDEAALAPLEPYATNGVTSLHHLADIFARLAPAVLATEHKGADDSLVERLKGYASNLVQIERAGDSPGKDVRTLVVRIKNALAHDHVPDAYAAWADLPDAAKAVSESFGTATKNRLDALDAARSIESGAVAALGKPKS
jgi:hypothetical protein